MPLLLTTDEGLVALTNDDQVVGVMQQQAEGMRAAEYDHSVVMRQEVTVINAASALYRGEFSRQRRDGTEINRLTATYLVTDGPSGRRISALAVHAP